MSKPADPLSGVKCFTIGGRMVQRRQRCLGMTDEERRWRAQWLKDQILSPSEPREVPEYYKATNHFLQRLYKTPLNKLEKALQPLLGVQKAYTARHVIGKSVPIYFMTLGIVYYFKYHTNNFETNKTVEFYQAPARMYPDYPDYPKTPVKKPSDYYDLGFYSSVLCQEVHYVPPPPPPPPPQLHIHQSSHVVQEVVEEEVVCIPSEVGTKADK